MRFAFETIFNSFDLSNLRKFKNKNTRNCKASPYKIIELTVNDDSLKFCDFSLSYQVIS